MITHRFHCPGPAQSAANHINDTLHNVAADVRELNGAVEELRSGQEARPETTRPEEPTSDQKPHADLAREAPAEARLENVPFEKPATAIEPATIKQNIAVEVHPDIAKPDHESPRRNKVDSKKVEPLASNGESDGARVSRPMRAEPEFVPDLSPRPSARFATHAASPFSFPPSPQSSELNHQMRMFQATMMQNQQTILRALQAMAAFCQQISSQHERIIREMERFDARLRYSRCA